MSRGETGGDPGANEALVELGDPAALHRHLDRLAVLGRWEELVDLGRRCRAATERGRQLWPVAAQVDYRLALEGPPPLAAAAATTGEGRFAPGPLTEVVASRCRFADLDPHLPPGPTRELVAQERVVRGEDLSDRADVVGLVSELSVRLAAWEPDYPVAAYHPAGVDAPPPALPAPEPAGPLRPAERVDDPVTVEALRDLVGTWVRDSNGRVEAVAVRGSAGEAVATLGPPRVRMAPLTPATALAWCAWAAGNGGAHGRRRGMAAARFDTWWALGALAGIHDVSPAEALGRAAGTLRWWRWDAYEPEGGWRLQLAIEDPATGRAYAINAADDA